jgi:hypothetical protein
MASGRDFTQGQKKIINRYYEHRDTIALNNLGEIVSELALAETDKARDRLWKRVETALAHLRANDVRVDKILKDRSLEGLARVLNELHAKPDTARERPKPGGPGGGPGR